MKKQIIGYENLYEIDDNGVIYSLTRNCTMGTYYDRYNYRIVLLFKDGKKSTRRVHRLIAEHFIPNPTNKPHINHIDGNRKNNELSNLEWCTASENAKHAWDTGLRKPESKTKRIEQIDIITGCVICTFDDMHHAERITGICRVAIMNYINKKVQKSGKNPPKMAGGYLWRRIT